MQWSKAKTILIMFFVIVDAVLLMYIATDNIHKSEVSKGVIDSLVTLLEKNGVNVDKNVIEQASDKNTIKTVYVENIVDDFESFAKLVLGEDTKGENESTFSSKTGKISFAGDNIKAEATKNSHIFEVEVNESNAEKNATQYLKSLGLETQGTTATVQKHGSDYNVKITRQINGYKIFDSILNVEMDAKGIKGFHGNIYNEIKNNMQDSELKGISGVLTDFMNKVAKNGNEYTINDLKLGYAVLETENYHKNITLMPVWQIYYNDGEYEYIDAREN